MQNHNSTQGTWVEPLENFDYFSLENKLYDILLTNSTAKLLQNCLNRTQDGFNGKNCNSL